MTVVRASECSTDSLDSAITNIVSSTRAAHAQYTLKKGNRLSNPRQVTMEATKEDDGDSSDAIFGLLYPIEGAVGA